jgi:phosphomannomutase
MLKKDPPAKIAGLAVTKVITIDGFKFRLADGSWAGLRLSGTEPVIRFYAESSHRDKVRKLLVAGEKLIQGK